MWKKNVWLIYRDRPGESGRATTKIYTRQKDAYFALDAIDDCTSENDAYLSSRCVSGLKRDASLAWVIEKWDSGELFEPLEVFPDEAAARRYINSLPPGDYRIHPAPVQN